MNALHSITCLFIKIIRPRLKHMALNTTLYNNNISTMYVSNYQIVEIFRELMCLYSEGLLMCWMHHNIIINLIVKLIIRWYKFVQKIWFNKYTRLLVLFIYKLYVWFPSSLIKPLLLYNSIVACGFFGFKILQHVRKNTHTHTAFHKKRILNKRAYASW